ncbi:MmcQ/YjbR family DNA-binding protein [Streptococcus himalayensis]|uniref:MmcQ/YjbR family DNA-binding protein n=1 Tax=Streptococcus himalayensis TaxID=1888195 RepID=A0A917AA44_9STRE|nr:MmcQ/YjbR family DNA-binding protein [Streptococcus himalayensis]GGE36649.1 hypothetical protein GCM10011510_17540 [Streptococcus himalayensis]
MIKDLFLGYKIHEQNLEIYGFHKKENRYEMTKAVLAGDFLLSIAIQDGGVAVEILDAETKESYAPFWVSHLTGSYIGHVREEVMNILLEIRAACFQQENFLYPQTQRMLEQIAIHYQGQLEYLWERLGAQTAYPTGAFRHQESKKWYGVLMTIDWAKLDPQKEGKIELLTLKHDAVPVLLKKEGYYPAYHMNKKYWISVPLNDRLSDQEVWKLMEKSYTLTR